MARFLVSNEAELRLAFEAASVFGKRNTIVFEEDAEIVLTQGLEYTGSGGLVLVGNGAELIASEEFQTFEGAGVDLDGFGVALITSRSSGPFRTFDLALNGNGGRAQHGFELDVPADADGVITTTFNGVEVEGFWDHGIHIDDQAGAAGGGGTTQGSKDDLTGNNSDASLYVKITDSEFAANGIYADRGSVSDNDGFRVDEGGLGYAEVNVRNSLFVANGADGLELDETGKGRASVNVYSSIFNDNGAFDLRDTDDGLDVDEAGNGNLTAKIFDSEISGNFDEGLDLDEAGNGFIEIEVGNTLVNNNGNAKLGGLADEPGGTGIKLSEEQNGSIFAIFEEIEANFNDDYGVRLEQFGGGVIDVLFDRVSAVDNRNDVPGEGGRNGIRLESFATGDGEEPEVFDPVFGAFFDVNSFGNGREGLQVDAAPFDAFLAGSFFDFVDFSNTEAVFFF